jgi:Rgg/GadR/MutR family transcriptional activator
VIGEILKDIRILKGFAVTEIAGAFSDSVSKSQLARIEGCENIPSIEHFIILLSRLNVSFEEFCRASINNHMKARVETKSELLAILRKKNSSQLKRTITKMDEYYHEYKDPYFHHMSCYVRATLILEESNYDYNEVLVVLRPISVYLASVRNWFEYEIGLFINCIYLYPIEKAIKIGNDALDKIRNTYMLLKDDGELARSMLLNLAIYALEDEKWNHQAYNYILEARALPESTNLLYYSLMIDVVHQVICYKVENGEYDEPHLVNLINSLKLIKLNDLYKQFIEFITKHGITLDHTESLIGVI